MREVLTAIESSMGSSGGITEVIIREQLSNNLYLLLVGSSKPYTNPSIGQVPTKISKWLARERYTRSLLVKEVCYMKHP